jgi:methylated-DNA-[protein]-cysteine S-methyltransferase
LRYPFFIMPESQEGSLEPVLASAPQPLRVLMPSPLGPLGVELLGTAVVGLRIDPPKPDRAAYTPFHKIEGSDALDEIFGHLSEYFAGARRKLEVEYDLGPCGVSGLTKRVLKEAAKIPYGRTRSHQALAEALGRPEDYRQVASALLENPIPILIPCHRVVPAKGLGSYIGGTDRKRWLLDMESRPAQDDEPL